MSSIQISLVVASKHPRKLSEFYAFATNGELLPGENDQHWRVVQRNGISLHFYKPVTNRPWPNRGRAASLCLEKAASVEPLWAVNQWIESLVSRGATVDQQPKVELFGAESWMTDPEGNNFLIFVPSSNN